MHMENYEEKFVENSVALNDNSVLLPGASGRPPKTDDVSNFVRVLSVRPPAIWLPKTYASADLTSITFVLILALSPCACFWKQPNIVEIAVSILL